MPQEIIISPEVELKINSIVRNFTEGYSHPSVTKQELIELFASEANRSKVLVEALENVEKSCDKYNPTHEDIWNIVQQALNTYNK